MSAISGVLKRDLRLAIRSGGAWLHSLIFFCVFLALCAVALGGNFNILRPLAPPLIWLALILSLLLSFERIFQEDADDECLLHIKLSKTSLSEYVIAKCAVQWVVTVLPVLLSLPLIALVFDVQLSTTAGLFFTILLASPALICYGAFSGACLVANKGSGVLLVLLTAPMLIPVLIFGISGATNYQQFGLYAIEFQALAGISLLALAAGIPTITAALQMVME